MTASPVRSPAYTRTTLLAASAAIVEEGGGKSLTTLWAAHRAKVAVGSVYRYFGDRDALLEATVTLQRWATLQALTSSLAGATRSDVPRLVVDQLIRSYAQGPRLAKAGLDAHADGVKAPAALLAALIAAALLPLADEEEVAVLAQRLVPACQVMESSVAYASPVEAGSSASRAITAAGEAAFTACLQDSQP